jgi:hypothetical protein
VARFPRAEYSRLSNYREPPRYFFEQLAQYDFRQGPPLVALPHLVVTDWWFGLVPKRSLALKRVPERLALSPLLLEGWRNLGIVDADGRLDLALSPGVLATRFTRATGWPVVRPREKDEPVLEERRARMAEGVVVADDLFDYLFVMPLLSVPPARAIFRAYARYSGYDLAELFDGPVPDWETRGDPRRFLEFLAQARYGAGGTLYSAGPIVLSAIPDPEKAHATARTRMAAVVRWLSAPDAALGEGAVRGADVFRELTSPAMHLLHDFAPGNLEDWLAVALGDQLYRLSHTVERRRGFGPRALAFARRQAAAIVRLLDGERPEELEAAAVPLPSPPPKALPGPR